MGVWQAIVTTFVVSLLALPAVADDTRGITDTTITIGNIGPFSGSAAVFTPINYGADAYLRYINAQGGVNGRTFVTVFADSGCNEAKGIAAAKKLIFEDKVFMIMSNPCSGVVMAIKPTLVQEGVPWMGAAANPKISTPTTAGIFHVVYPGSEAGHAMATFALSKSGTTKIALAMHSDDWAHGYCDAAQDYIKSHGGEIVGTTILEHGATDATAQALRIKASGAQAVMGCLYQPELIVLLRDLQKYQINTVVVAALGADFDQVVQAFPNHDWLKGHFYQPYQYQAKIGTGPLKKFHDIFIKYLTKDELPKTGEPTNFYYYGVPSAIVAVEAFRRAGINPTRESWEKAVESLKDFDTGVLADTETFSHDDHVGVHKMYAVGLDEQGVQTVYRSWGVALPNAN